MTSVVIPILVAVLLLSGCATEAQRRAAENAAIKKEAAQEMSRICTLPPAEREAELDRLKTESGMIVHCGKE